MPIPRSVDPSNVESCRIAGHASQALYPENFFLLRRGPLQIQRNKACFFSQEKEGAAKNSNYLTVEPLQNKESKQTEKKLTGKGLEKEPGKGLKRDETKVGTMRALPSPESMAFMMSASGDSTSNSGRRSVTSGPQMDKIAG